MKKYMKTQKTVFQEYEDMVVNDFNDVEEIDDFIERLAETQ